MKCQQEKQNRNNKIKGPVQQPIPVEQEKSEQGLHGKNKDYKDIHTRFSGFLNKKTGRSRTLPPKF